MSERQEIARHAAAGLRRFAVQAGQIPVTLGFDGFIDSIFAVVDKRHDADSYDAVPTIERFGRKILDAVGKSANYELALKVRKLGGNGPIMANALLEMGFPVTYIGALGFPEVHPIFEQISRRAGCYSICDPGLTDAMEFDDGKLMFGKHESIGEVGLNRIDEVVGRQQFARIVNESALLGMVNWTMLVNMNDIWRRLIDEILPGAGAKSGKRLLIFVDLADPEKRTREDLRNAIELLTQMQKHADVMLGLNLKESTQVAHALGINPGNDAESAIKSTAAAIRDKLQLDAIVIHPRKSAAAATKSGSAHFFGAFTQHPKLSTGAGDNFNTGFCVGRLAGLPLEQMLCAAVATSGYYVRHAASPTLDQLADFCDKLPPSE